MSKGLKPKVGITLEREMIFKCNLGDMKVKDCFIDDTHQEEANMLGPNPSRLLGLALLGCLSASFIFCLKKKELTVDDLKAEAELIIARNDKGFWRVKKIDVEIEITINDPDTRKRADRCKKMFEQYCTVTQSVRHGIDVEVNINY